MAIANQLRSLSLLTLLSSSLLLAACGGGGSSGGGLSSQASSTPNSSSSSLSSESSSESLSSASSDASPGSSASATSLSSVSSQSSDASQNSVSSSSSSSSSGVVVVPTYSVGGSLQGIVGAGLQIANGSDQLALTANGNFVFTNELHQGDSYIVTVTQQPTAPAQTCVLANASGTVGAADITNVQISCTTNTYSVGGDVSGLSGSGLVLQNNAGDDLAVAADGSFTFATALDDGSNFAVTIATQPSSPSQTCSLTNATGTLNGANNSAVNVSCTTNSYTIGGSVSGLTATGLVLQNNDGDDLIVDANGNFVFATALADQSAFSVSVKTQPEKHLCSVTGASGNLAGANISSVTVSCLNAPAAPTLALAYGPKLFKFTWDAIDGTTHYKLLENADGNSGYTQVGDDLTVTNYDEEVTLFNRIGAQYILEACNQAGCNTSAVVNVSEHLEEAIGYVQPALAEDGDEGGGERLSMAISADGNTLVFGAYGNDSNSASDETDNSTINSGAVYVFQKEDGLWQQQAFLKASTIDVGDGFGFRVALSADGNVLAVGSINEKSNAQGINGDESDNSALEAGAVYVFKRTGSSWAQQAYIKASNTTSQDYQDFGVGLALSADGQTLAVGALGESSNATGVGGDETDVSAQYAGAVYVFGTDGDSWVQQAYIKASNTDAGDTFGSVVSLSADGNRLAVGAVGEDSSATGVGGNQADNSKSNSGAVYIFDRVLGNWSQQAYLKASMPDPDDRFGDRLALSGDGKTLAVGTDYEASAATGINGDESDNSADSSGAVYLFALGESGWSQQAYIKASNTESDDLFGVELALTYDGSLLAVGARWELSLAIGLNGDQFDDGGDTAGAVYLFKLKQTGWEQFAYVKAPIQHAPEFGSCLGLTADGGVLAVAADIPDNNIDNNYTSLPGGIYLY